MIPDVEVQLGDLSDIALVVQLCLYFADLYDAGSYADLRELFIRLVQGLGAASFCLALLYFWLPGLMIGRGIFLISSVLVVIVVGGWRLADHWTSGRSRPSGWCGRTASSG